MLAIIEKQVSKKATHFEAQLSSNFEMLLGRYSSHLGICFGRRESQNHSAHLLSSSRPNHCAGHPGLATFRWWDIEIDESYFGAKRIRGRRGRGAGGKTPVLGLHKRQGRVFVSIVQNRSKSELVPILQGRIVTLIAEHFSLRQPLFAGGAKLYWNGKQGPSHRKHHLAP